MELSKTKFNLYASLQSSKMRRKHSLFIVEGEKSVRDALKIYSPVAIIKIKDSLFDFISSQHDVFEVSTAEMHRLSSLSTPTKIIAVFSLPEAVEEDLACDPYRLYLLLDAIQDPGNLGTIIRTCHWFGIDTIFASRNTVDLYNPKTLQATMGSFTKVRVIYCELAELIQKNRPMPVYGLLLDGDDIYRANLGKRGFIVMGNEGKGISAALRGLITHRLLIPPATADHSESLNVAVATGITLSQFIGHR